MFIDALPAPFFFNLHRTLVERRMTHEHQEKSIQGPGALSILSKNYKLLPKALCCVVFLSFYHHLIFLYPPTVKIK
jgi:hypothetical protein